MTIICDFGKCQTRIFFSGSPLLTVKRIFLSDLYYQAEHLLRTSLPSISTGLEALGLPSLSLRHTEGCVNGRRSVRLEPICFPDKQHKSFHR